MVKYIDVVKHTKTVLICVLTTGYSMHQQQNWIELMLLSVKTIYSNHLTQNKSWS